MASRLELQSLLESILGSRNVYFQPPANVRMSYPAIVYERIDIPVTHADDRPYLLSTVYQVVVIDPNPDSPIVYKLAQLPKCRHTSHYKQDNLNHDAFKLYF